MNEKPGRLMAAILAAAGLVVATAAAEEATPAVDKPAAQEAAEASAQPEIKPEAKPEVTPEAKPEAAKPEPKPEATKPELKSEPKTEAPAKPAENTPKVETATKPEAPKELTPCAKTLVPLADSYKKAYEELEKWIGDVDAQTAAATTKIEKIQEQIEKNESAITKLRLQGTRASSAKGRDLATNNKLLWSELSATRKESSALCAGFAREAVQKARHYQSDVAAKLEGVKAQLK